MLMQKYVAQSRLKSNDEFYIRKLSVSICCSSIPGLAKVEAKAVSADQGKKRQLEVTKAKEFVEWSWLKITDELFARKSKW